MRTCARSARRPIQGVPPFRPLVNTAESVQKIILHPRVVSGLSEQLTLLHLPHPFEVLLY